MTNPWPRLIGGASESANAVLSRSNCYSFLGGKTVGSQCLICAWRDNPGKAKDLKVGLGVGDKSASSDCFWIVRQELKVQTLNATSQRSPSCRSLIWLMDDLPGQEDSASCSPHYNLARGQTTSSTTLAARPAESREPRPPPFISIHQSAGIMLWLPRMRLKGIRRWTASWLGRHACAVNH